MRTLFGIFVFLLLSSKLFAAEVCVTVDTEGMTQRELNTLRPAAQQIAKRAGSDKKAPQEKSPGVLCFQDPSFDTNVITRQALIDEVAAILTASGNDQVQEEAEYQTLKSEWLVQFLNPSSEKMNALKRLIKEA